jgi:di/tricarboxylate transporter
MDASILMVILILISTVIMLALEIFRIDVVALLCMAALGWTGVVKPDEVFSGLSSNAVVAMIAVMIMGGGIEKTGIMDRFSRAIIRTAGSKRKKIIGLVSLTIGALSGFIQNIGAAALFLPGILNISRQTKIPSSVLIMPIGFAAILGGTVTMVGSGPLILINDLLQSANLAPYGLFSVTPVGILLLFAGIGYFFFFGKFVLPGATSPDQGISQQEEMVKELHLPDNMKQYTLQPNSPLIGKTTEQSGLWDEYQLNLLAASRGQEIVYAPWREEKFELGQQLLLLGDQNNIERFAAAFHLIPEEQSSRFASLSDTARSGFAEVILPPRSQMSGLTLREFSLRRRYAVEPIALFSKGQKIQGDFSDHRLSPGDDLILHGLWEHINDLKNSSDFVVTTPFTIKKKEESKSWAAMLCFVLAIGLAVAGFSISMAFFTGALAMVLLRVISIQEAYGVIEWKVVFLLAGLIPLGIAMQKTGTATLLAETVMNLIKGAHPIYLVITVAVLSTLFSLFMSNVGAIVVLTPLVINMANLGGMDPRPLALMAAVCTANSFLLPTHQVNAMLMSAGSYRNADYFKAGAGMTLIFIAVVVMVFYAFYL